MHAVESNTGKDRQKPVSGVAMDRPVQRRRFWHPRLYLVVAAVAMTAVLAGFYLQESGTRTLAIENTRIVVSPVTAGVFEDYIPIRGRVTPLKPPAWPSRPRGARPIGIRRSWTRWPQRTPHRVATRPLSNTQRMR